MGNCLLETSRLIKLLKVIYSVYVSFENQLNNIYVNSLLHRMTNLFLGSIKVAFRYSFLGMITEIRKDNNLEEIVKNSRSLQRFLREYSDWRKRINNYLTTSIIANYAIRFKNKFYTFPVKTGSIVIIIAIASDIVSEALLNNKAGFTLWVVRGLLLFVGLIGLSCRANLENILNTSLISKWVIRER